MVKALEFGDRAYTQADFNSPYVHHPKAPFTYKIGNVLRQAYLASQHNARMIICQSYGFNTRNLETSLNAKRTVDAGSGVYIGVARGWRTVPPETNVLRGHFVYGSILSQLTRARLRLKIDNGTVADYNESIVETEALAQGFASPGDVGYIDPQLFPYTPSLSVLNQSVQVDLSEVSVTTPGLCEIRMEFNIAYSTDGGSTYDGRIPTQPFYAMIWAEMRY